MKNNLEYKEEFNRLIDDYARSILRKKLSMANSQQIELFNRLYKSIDEIPLDKMAWAYSQVMRTVDTE
ncbi:hypothetical protein LCGC14_1104250 [marine sediment metagenome]|uniref:Uncharacterized protein n=1 Tax=marine sediment metagenome TaxID=412755 RepID=A0A0F9QEX1_9ZZZZ